MAGYTRQDTANNIANGNVIDADDFDAEYNAIEAGFNASTGHSHDGTAGEGAPITKVGPSQDLVVSATALTPKTTNTLDLGTASVQYKNAWFDGTVDTDVLTVSENATVGGTLGVTGVLTATGGVTGAVTGNVTGNVTGTVSDVSNHDTDDISEGSTNQYFTTARARSSVSAAGSLNYNSGTGVISFTQGDTDTVAEGTTNLYYTDARATAAAKAAISVTDDGGDGSLTYSAGAITYTGPSAAETRAHFSGGTGVSITNGTVAIGQAVGTTSNVTFNDAVVNGNLTVNGTTTTVNTETLNLADNQIVLNSNETGTPTQNGGIEIERGTAANKTLVWNETDDKWTVGSETFVAGTFEGALTGNVTGTIQTAAQPNITSLGTLTALTVDDISINGSTISDATGMSILAGGNIEIQTTAADIILDATGNTTVSSDLSVSNDIIMTAGDQDWKFEVTNVNKLSVSYSGSTMFNINTGGYIDDTSFWFGEIRHSNLFGAITEQFTNDTSAATGAVNFDCKTQAVYLNSANASGNVQLNFRGDSGTTFANIVPVGKSLTAVYALNNGTTPYYVSDVKIDGTSQLSSQEFFWQNGTQPSSGNASGMDVYTFTFFRRSSSEWTIFANRTFYGT